MCEQGNLSKLIVSHVKAPLALYLAESADLHTRKMLHDIMQDIDRLSRTDRSVWNWCGVGFIGRYSPFVGLPQPDNAASEGASFIRRRLSVFTPHLHSNTPQDALKTTVTQSINPVTTFCVRLHIITGSIHTNRNIVICSITCFQNCIQSK